jgi:hypothetical protein
VCRSHGGAAGSGKNSAQGRESQRGVVTVHGDESLAKRAARSEASKKRRRLENKIKVFEKKSPLIGGQRKIQTNQPRYRCLLEAKSEKTRASVS